jgi:hypothetical protein
LFDAPGYGNWHKVQEAAGSEWDKAFEDMLATQPTTRSGAGALIDCFLQSERELLDENSLALVERLRTILAAA